MKNLRLQDGCHNCRHRFVKAEYDGEYQIYCAIDGGRPLCGSVLLEETFPGLGEWSSDESARGKFSAAIDAWDAWSEPRKVQPAHICDLYEQKGNNDEVPQV